METSETSEKAEVEVFGTPPLRYCLYAILVKARSQRFVDDQVLRLLTHVHAIAARLYVTSCS